ncbi:hypothetical protein [Desulfobacula sp.]|uniref:hypothetical protein n=1 Tax=Desulfobacula sp. TaxID=2593537 RepID=UPI0026052BFF|nr:hypothetical protein [Desulfobacula sp.]
MAQKLLSVSRHRDSIRGIFVEKKGGGYFAGSPVDLSSKEALNSACSRADEIYINDSFLSAIYVWDLFPKVAPKHISHLLHQDALDKFQSSGEPNIGFQILGEVQTEGIRQREIAYMAVEEEEIVQVWSQFKKHTKKIKGITSLPASISATVAKFESLDANFVVTWIGDTESVMSIASKDGIIKVARSFPFGLKGLDLNDEDTLRAFSQKIDKELNRTINFFKQGFREPEPEKIFLFGDRHLQQIFEVSPLSIPGASYFFQFTSQLINNYSQDDETENFHIISSLFLNKNFNFLPQKVVADRKSKRLLYPAYAILAVVVLGLLFWNFQLRTQINDEDAKLRERQTTAMAFKSEVEALEVKINKLEPFQEWKVFYDQTFNDKLPWDRILSDFGRTTPPDIVLDSLSINPAGQNKWLANVSGKIRAISWEAGLEQIRDYGAKIDALELFIVKTVNYAPQNLEENTKFFNFNLLLEFNKMEQ